MDKLSVSIVGGSGYTGGELLRLLLFHPAVEIRQITSERNAGKLVTRQHPNLRTVTTLKFSSMEELEKCDLLFLCLPHGQSMEKIDFFRTLAPKIIDLSGDFRLRDTAAFEKWYEKEHVNPGLLEDFVYGIPELHRAEMKNASFISSAGCNATSAILGLYPLYKQGVVSDQPSVIEVKAGTSQAGASFNEGSHHPERSGAIRTYKPFGHRHTGEIIQELSIDKPVNVHFTATSIDMVRGIHCVSHVFLNDDLNEKDIWKMYRSAYGDEPFIRIVKEQSGIHRLPDPKILSGSNYCDIGFIKDTDSNRLVVISAIDNLMKGAAGQAVQAFNIMNGFDETTALTFPGLHPV
ncbi:MAG: N-acetyl-gamma-glutamyl-phosphate reductase [Calditrichae bacterium]|nr:N-acetyl-gamma-glutamyl-phosphate reductase [Calditrichia bacterium]